MKRKVWAAIISFAMVMALVPVAANAAAVTAPEISTASLANGTIGTAYSQTLAADGTAPITWKIISSNLPDSIVLDADTGVISGTWAKTGTFTFTVKAANTAGYSTKQFSVTVYDKPAIPTITTASLSSGIIGTDYSQTLMTDSTTPVTWEIISGNLPDSIALDADTGVISGTWSKTGTFTFTVKAANTLGYGTKKFSVTVYSVDDAPAITTASLASGTVGKTYSQKLAVNGADIAWSIDSGSLPSGFSLNANTGVISGVSAKSGTFTFTVKAENAVGSDTKQLSITLNNAALSAATVSNDNTDDTQVKENPHTGDNGFPWLWTGITLLAGAGLAAALIAKHPNKVKNRG